MKRPTLEEVREYFKDAEKIYFNGYIYKDYTPTEFDIDTLKVDLDTMGFYCDCSQGDILLYDFETESYAQIITYKESTYNSPQKDFKTITDGIKVKNPKSTHYHLWENTEVIDVIKSMLTEEEYKGFLKGNLLKYRLRDKGQDESDKEKAKDYKNELEHLNK